MARIGFKPMVFEKIDKNGIWWRGSKDNLPYLLSWNPLHWIYNLFFSKVECYFGFLPFTTKHLK